MSTSAPQKNSIHVMQPATQPTGPRFLFRLRTLLLIVAAIAAVLAGIGWLWSYVLLEQAGPALHSRNWKLRGTFPGKSEIAQVQFSPDGATLVTGYADGTLILWDVAQCKFRLTLQVVEHVKSISFTPDSMYLVAASGRTLRMFDVMSGQLVNSIAHNGDVSAFCFSAANNTFATFVGTKEVNIRNLETLQEVAIFPCGPTLDPHLSFSPDGNYLAVTQYSDWTASLPYSANQLTLIDIRSGIEKWSLTDRYFIQAEFSRDSKSLLTLCGDQSVTIWNTVNGKERLTLTHNLDGWLTNVAFIADNQNALAGMQLVRKTTLTKFYDRW